MKIVSPKYDYCMKELFRNEVVRRHFLSDVLDIPPETIRSSRLLNTFLWKRYRNQKLGILDVLIELNDDTKINIEIQVKVSADWDKRQIFYLSKLYTADLHMGNDYTCLRPCIGISILDFNLNGRPEYHSIYRLTDAEGNLFSNMLEIHTIELKKKLAGQNRVDDWIRLFNAETEEDLDMIKTKNAGICEAVREVKLMSLGKRLRAHYEAYLKDMRDQAAREKYVRQEAMENGFNKGMEKGLEEGIEKGIEKGKEECIGIFILDNMEEGKSKVQIIKKLIIRFNLPEKDAERLMDKYMNNVNSTR